MSSMEWAISLDRLVNLLRSLRSDWRLFLEGLLLWFVDVVVILLKLFGFLFGTIGLLLLEVEDSFLPAFRSSNSSGTLE